MGKGPEEGPPAVCKQSRELLEATSHPRHAVVTSVARAEDIQAVKMNGARPQFSVTLATYTPPF